MSTVNDSCSDSTTSGNETCNTAAGRPQWFLLVVLSNQERKVAKVLQARGYEVFLPMHTVRRQWSDRLKTYDAPLFPCHLFCRAQANTELMALRVFGVVQIFPGRGKQLPIPDEEIERVRRIAASQYPVECSVLPQTGDIVEIPGDIPIRGVLVERASVCRVAIGFEVMGQTLVLRVPLVDLKRLEGQLTPHWSLHTL